MSDLQDTSFVVTGANTGIGRATAHGLAARGAEVVLACRNASKAQAVVRSIQEDTGNSRVFFHQLDLADLAAIRRSAAAYLDSGRKIDVLINNAGLAGHRGLTNDGFELTFGTNHLGHFLWTLLLLPRIADSVPARIVNVASRSHYQAKGIDFAALAQPTRTLIGLHEYEVSKLANVLFSAELGRRLAGKGVTTYSLNPGQIASNIWQRIPWPIRPIMTRFMKSNEEGARTSLHCATEAALAKETGKYYEQCRQREPSGPAQDQALATELWERSCEMVGLTVDESFL